MTSSISFNITNARRMILMQRTHDGRVLCATSDHAPIDDADCSAIDFISAGDMVQLINLYRYIKRNDIQNDFINPHGKNKEI